MKKLQFLIANLALLTGICAEPLIGPELQNRLLSKTGSVITVIAKFKSQAPISSSLTGKTPNQVLKQKRIIASIAQQPLLNLIAAERKKSSRIAKIESLWINNSMVISADQSFIESILKRDDLERVDLDVEIKLFDPIVKSVEKGIDTADFTYGLKKIQAARVWNELGINGEGITVGVLDTGIDTQHETLVGRTVATKDFVSEYQDNTPNDGHGHGTHCSGTIGGTNSGGKHIGVAPGVKFIVGKIFGDNGSTSTAAIMNGMQWITDPDGNPETNDFPRVISNSWGGPLNDRWQEIINTWRSIGIIPVFAAGNSGPSEGTVGAPGAYEEVISIGATDAQDEIAYFSSRGPVSYNGKTYIKPDVSAPGVDVYSAKPGGGFQNMSGTSMATPHVAGVAALMLQADPQISAERIQEILEETALELGDEGKDASYGSGRVNAFDAVNLVLSGGKAAIAVDAGDQIASIRVMPGNKVYKLENGSKTISLPAGNYQFVASAFGYFSQTLDVEIKAKETSALNLVLELAPSFNVKFTTRNEEETILNSKITFLGVPVEGGQTNGGDLEVVIPGGEYTVQVKTMGYQTTQINFSISKDTHLFFAIEKLPEFLIVDHGKEGNALAKYYTDALQTLGKQYNLVTKIIPEGINGYQTIIWYTGRSSAGYRIANSLEQEMLMNFVASGGRLIMTGQDIGYALKNTSFYENFLGARFLTDTSDIKTVSKNGLSFELDGEDSANNQKWPDTIGVYANDDSVNVLYSYQGKGPAIISNTHENGKTIYMAFGFEGISGSSIRLEVLKDLLKTLEATPGELLERIQWAYNTDPEAYEVLIKNFSLSDGNREEVIAYLDKARNKSAFRPILQMLLTR